jgi:hypothetical protein
MITEMIIPSIQIEDYSTEAQLLNPKPGQTASQ